MVITLLSLVCEKCKPVKDKERKTIYFSTSTDEEVVLKGKLAGVFKDVIKHKLVVELEDKVYIY